MPEWSAEASFDPVNRFYSNPGDEAFARWKPKVHLVAPRGWMNDPCAPFYDVASGLYHLFYQWNPKGSDWGNMSWGHSTSPDMIHWTDKTATATSTGAALLPDTSYDKDGVFTGCFALREGDEEGKLGLLYTSVSGTIYFEDGSYGKGSETLSYASSGDGGTTWMKSSMNPFVAGPPEEVMATGWRDPYVCKSKALDDLFRPTSPQNYAVIAGGVKDAGPALFLYSYPTDNIFSWTYLGQLYRSDGSTRSSEWAGINGNNWEVGNFFRLHTSEGKTHNRDYLILGAQFDQKVLQQLPIKLRTVENPDSPGLPLWKLGTIVQSASGVDFMGEATGLLDYGWYYAANSFEDPLTGRRIVWGWILECDLSSERRARQGWAGCISLPRVLSPLFIYGVVSPVSKGYSLSSLDNFVVSSPLGALPHFTVETMGIQLADETIQLWQEQSSACLKSVACGGSTKERPVLALADAGLSCKVELDIDIAQSESTETELKIFLRHSPGFEEVTTINYSPSTATVQILRSASTLDQSGVGTSTQLGYFTLFNILQADEQFKPEPLRLTIVCDNSVIEVFANGRFAMTTRVYPTRQDSTGISFGATSKKEDMDESVGILVKRCEVWRTKDAE